MVTGTTACSPSVAVSLSLVLHTSGLLATATCDWSGKLTPSMPHSGLCARCNGLDSESSNPPERRPDAVTRSAGGTVTVSVCSDGCGPCTRTSSRVCLPGGTGTRTRTPSADRLPWCPCPFSVTVRWLRATIWRPEHRLWESAGRSPCSRPGAEPTPPGARPRPRRTGPPSPRQRPPEPAGSPPPG